MTTQTFGERIDANMGRMDAAYAEHRRFRMGTPEYDPAKAEVETVYADLRALNRDMGVAS